MRGVVILSQNKAFPSNRCYILKTYFKTCFMNMKCKCEKEGRLFDSYVLGGGEGESGAGTRSK